METKKFNVSEMLVEQFLRDVEEKGTFQWQRPYEVMTPFNWLTMEPYRGFNRILLPMGEYLTQNQIRKVNRENDWDYRFQKGIKWWQITYFKVDKKSVSGENVIEIFEGLPEKVGFIGVKDGWAYYLNEDGRYHKQRNVLQYYAVCDIKHLRNSKGEPFPSRLKSGEVGITLSKPDEVFNSYIDREGITVNRDNVGTPCYIPAIDIIELNPLMNGEEEYWSTAFHEAAHSTGAFNRLNREGVVNVKKNTPEYAKEECIAEICAGLCCAECGVYKFETSESKAYENNLAYVQAYKKRIKEWGSDFIYIASQAEKAFEYIMGY